MKILLTCLLTFFLIAGHATAADVTLAWDANSEPEVIGYRLHYGTENVIPFTEAVDVKKVTEHTLTGLAQDQTYFFAVTAYSIDQESEYSNIVQYIIRPDRVIIRVLDRPKSIRAVFD